MNKELLVKIIVGVILFSSFFYLCWNMVDPDMGWHLRVGEEIAKTKSVPHFDKFSFTMPGFEWVDHEWLVDAWFWLFNSNELWRLMVLIFSLIVFLPFFFWLKDSDSFFNLWLVILTAVLMFSFIGVRPQMISFAFFFLVFRLLYKSQPKQLYFLPLIFFIWANLHGGFFAGLVLLGLFVLVRFLLEWRRTKLFSNSVLKLYLPIFLASLGLTLINPYTWKLYQEIFVVFSSFETVKYIIEWQSGLIFFGVSSSVFLGLFLFMLIRYFKRYPLELLAVSLFFLIMYLKSARMGPLFFITALPILMTGAGFIKEEVGASRQKKPFSPKELKVFKIGRVLAFVFVFGVLAYGLVFYHQFQQPKKAVEFLREQKQEHNIFNIYGWGGYLIWHLPEIKVFIDGRMPHWQDKSGNSAMKDYIKVFYSDNETGWKEVFAKRKITQVLIENDTEDKDSFLGKIRGYLLKFRIIKQLYNFFYKEQFSLKASLIENGWEIVYQDDIALILERPSGL